MVPGGYVPQKYFGVSNKGLKYCIQARNPKPEGATWLTLNHCKARIYVTLFLKINCNMSDGLRKCTSGILILWLIAQRTGPVLGGPASAPANQQIWDVAWIFPRWESGSGWLPNICFQKQTESRRHNLLIRKQFQFLRDLFWYAWFPKTDSDRFL